MLRHVLMVNGMAHTVLHITSVQGIFSNEKCIGTDYPRVSEEICKKHCTLINLRAIIQKEVPSHKDSDVKIYINPSTASVYTHQKRLTFTNDKRSILLIWLVTCIVAVYRGRGETIYVYVLDKPTVGKGSADQAIRHIYDAYRKHINVGRGMSILGGYQLTFQEIMTSFYYGL